MAEDRSILNVVNKIKRTLDNAKTTAERVKQEEDKRRESVPKFQAQ